MLKRPRLSKRDDASSPPTGGSSSSAPPSGSRSTGSGISPADLAKALGGGYSAPAGLGGGAGGSAASGISADALGQALTGGGTSAGNRSVASSRHTSYPLTGELTGLPAKAGTRKGPRTTSYRIPLQRSSQQNVYDTVN